MLPAESEMKKVCPNDENRVSRKPPASQRALSRRKARKVMTAFR
jgi:hypothetical protein